MKNTFKALTVRLLLRTLLLSHVDRQEPSTATQNQGIHTCFCFISHEVCVTNRAALFTFATGNPEVLSMFLDVCCTRSSYLDSSYFFFLRTLFLFMISHLS